MSYVLADLIMLGLATHEPQFTIIREEFKPNKVRPCDICGQVGEHVISNISVTKMRVKITVCLLGC